MERHSFTTNGKTTSYLSSGPLDGPLLIFVHGWPELASTWKHQLTHFSALGFRCIAPDMLGYGLSSAPRTVDSYSLRSLVADQLALLSHLNRPSAIWAAHDWGSGVVWALAAHHPSVCEAVISLCIAYRSVELGLDHLVSLVDRTIYPADQFPHGQWGYMAFYEAAADQATASFDDNAARFFKLVYNRANPASFGKPAHTATVLRDGGWFGGRGGQVPDVPLDTSLLDEELYAELLDSQRRNGFWGANAYYLNHKANAVYAGEAAGRLDMPVLFVDAKYDAVCTVSGDGNKMAGPMREYCKDLTEVTVEASHWVALEKPEEVNLAVAKFLEAKLPKRSMAGS
jgi:soluble epoxide hydrolase / lipid-phosphate phosphatase